MDAKTRADSTPPSICVNLPLKEFLFACIRVHSRFWLTSKLLADAGPFMALWLLPTTIGTLGRWVRKGAS